MNIAIFTDIFLEVPGGICSSIMAQKAGLEALGHKVTIFCPGWSRPKDKSIVIIPTMSRHLKINGAPVSHAPEKVIAWVNANYPMLNQFDIIHVHYEASCSLAGIKLARQFHIPLVQTMHGREDVAIQTNVPHPFKYLVATTLNFLHSTYLPHPIIIKKDHNLAPTHTRAKMWTLMVNHANAADAVITPSYHFAKKLQEYGVKRKITRVSNAIDDAVASAEDWPVRSFSPGQPLKLFWNSRVSHEKRIMVFLEAINLATKKSATLKVTICGDGNAEKEAKEYVSKNHLQKIVKFEGRVSHATMLNRMKEQHLSVLTSYGFDIQPMTLLEAEAVGLPVLICDPDMREVTAPSGTVFCPKPDASTIATTLYNLSQTPSKITELSKAMLAHRKEVLISTQVAKMLEVYQSLLRHHPSINSNKKPHIH